MSINNFYKRDIALYKHMRVIDSDNDGIKDTLALMPVSNQFFLQVGMNQNMDDLGIYDRAENDDFEVIDFSGFWDEDNDGIGDGWPGDNFSGFTDPIFGDGTGATSGGNYGCMDPNSAYYSPFATDGCPPAIDPSGAICGTSGCTYITDCCNVGDTFPGGGYGDNAGGSGEAGPPTCLAFYTDWGPWNNDLTVDDTEQIYNIKETCSYTIRFINTYSQPNNNTGGWHGAELKIEIDTTGTGNNFQDLTPTSPELTSIEGPVGDLMYISSGEWTLGSKVRVGVAKDQTGPSTNYYYTKPYRDLIFTPPVGTLLRLTFRNGSGTLWNSQSPKISYQVFKGFQSSSPTAAPKDPIGFTATNNWSWVSGLSNIAFGGFPNQFSSVANGRLLYGPFATQSFAENNWNQYLRYPTNQNTQQWPTINPVPISSFYTDNDLINEAGIFTSYILQNSVPNNQGEVYNGGLPCTVTNNPVTYYDKTGDGWVEVDTNYPTSMDGSIDDGLFGKTRFDSPYIFIKPGTSDGTNPFVDNSLTTVQTITPGAAGASSTPSSGGWRNYGYAFNSTLGTYSYKTVNPTCQLGGCDVLPNTWPSLIEPSNGNIFLPQPDPANGTLCATYGSEYFPVVHAWNAGYAPYDAMGNCCAKAGNVGVDSLGPWEDTECPRCHAQMTTRSAQPVLDQSVKLAMQTTDSNTYYGPFYDHRNPTYNGYGLAFSKANNWCRNVKNLNGVIISTSGQTNVYNSPFSEVINGLANYVIMGGIIHGGAYQTNPNTNFNHPTNPLNVSANVSQWYSTPSNAIGCPSRKFPLKCKKVTSSDNNCPSGNCMKCLFCFFCTEEPKQPGVFTGYVSPTGTTTGPTGLQFN